MYTICTAGDLTAVVPVRWIFSKIFLPTLFGLVSFPMFLGFLPSVFTAHIENTLIKVYTWVSIHFKLWRKSFTFFILNSSFKQKYQRNFIDKTFFTNMQPLFINSKSNINNSLFNPGFKDQLMPVVVSLLSIRCFVLLPYKRRNRGWGAGGGGLGGLTTPHPIFFGKDRHNQ